MKNNKEKYFGYVSDIKADNRMATYFEHLVYTDEFQSKVSSIRKNFNIPEKGIGEYPTRTKSKDPDKIFDRTNFNIPNKLNTQEFDVAISELCHRNGFDSDTWFDLFSHYITFGGYDRLSFGKSYGIYDMNTDSKRNFSFSKMYAEVYPIAILIDPYTSLTELKDILDKTYKDTIKPMQLKLQDPESKMGNIKIIEKRLVPVYEFIKKNISVPSSELVKMINKRFTKDWYYNRVDKIKRERNYNKIKK